MQRSWKEPITVYLYEPDRLVRYALSGFFVTEDDMMLAGATGDRRQAVSDLGRFDVDVLIIGLRTDNEGLPADLFAACQRVQTPLVIALDAVYDTKRRQAVESLPGAVYILKTLPQKGLREGIRAVLNRLKKFEAAAQPP